MTSTRCKICREPERRRLIEADWAGGMSAVGIARRMTDAGWQLGSETVLKHLKEHAGPGAATRQPPNLSKRDIAVIVQERTVDWLEREDEQGVKVGPDHPLWKDALAPGLAAQKIIDTRQQKADDNKLKFVMAQLLLGGPGGGMFAPPQLTAGEDESEDIYEGEAVEVE